MNDRGPSLRPFRAYLPIVITCILIAGVPCAIQVSCIGVFFPAIAQDLDIPVSSISLFMSLGFLSGAVVSTIVGKLLVNRDIRLVASALVAITSLCYLGLAFADSVVVIWVAGALSICFGLSLINIVITTLINNWFKDYNGTLIGLSIAFTGFGGVVLIALGDLFMAQLGWRSSFIFYGLISLIACLPFTLFVIRSHPQERGMLPFVSRKSLSAEAEAAQVVAERNWTVAPSRAMRSGAFYLICLCGAVANMVNILATFFPTYVNDLATAGVAVAITGALLAIIVSGFQALGKLVIGIASDLSPQRTVILASSSGIAAILLIWFGYQSWPIYVGGAIFGLFYSSAGVLIPILTTSVFGSGKNYSAIYGRELTLIQLIACPAGLIWPWIAEHAGGYPPVFAINILLLLIFATSALIALRMGRRIKAEALGELTRPTLRTASPVHEASAPLVGSERSQKATPSTLSGAAAAPQTGAAFAKETL